MLGQASDGARRATSSILVIAGLLAGLLLLTACNDPAGSGGASPSPQGVDPYEVPAECSDFSYWQEAQDALDLDSALETTLDDDYDGVACNELGQSEYEEAWPTGYAEACEAVFLESPDGVLYLDGTGYEETECEDTDSGAVDWEADSSGDPEVDGKRDAWIAACDQFFNGLVGGDLYWGDDVSVSQYNCEEASTY